MAINRGMSMSPSARSKSPRRRRCILDWWHISMRVQHIQQAMRRRDRQRPHGQEAAVRWSPQGAHRVAFSLHERGLPAKMRRSRTQARATRQTPARRSTTCCRSRSATSLPQVGRPVCSSIRSLRWKFGHSWIGLEDRDHHYPADRQRAADQPERRRVSHRESHQAEMIERQRCHDRCDDNGRREGGGSQLLGN